MGSLAGALLLALAATAPPAGAEDTTPPAGSVNRERHCLHFEHEQRAQCFRSFDRAIAEATNGAVRLGPGFEPAELTDAMLDAAPAAHARRASGKAPGAGSNVAGILFQHRDYRGDTEIIMQSSRCRDGGAFSSPDLRLRKFNDKTSSVKAFGGCKVVLHEDALHEGARYTCPRPARCEYVGDLLNDEASSVTLRG